MTREMERPARQRDAEAAALLALGWEPARVSSATGIPEGELPGVVKALVAARAARKAAARRGLDARGVLSAAAAYRKVLSADPFASPPAVLSGVMGRKVEIDPGLAGLDRHLVVAFTEVDDPATRDAALQVGVEDAWEAVGMLGGRYVVPAGAGAAEAWNLHQSWNHVSAYLDVRVDAAVQSFNPSSLLLLRGAMDWGMWRLRAEHVVVHDEVIGRFEAYRYRTAVRSPRHDGAGRVGEVLDRQLASSLCRGDGGLAGADRDAALAALHQQRWAPVVAFDPAWRAAWLDRLLLVVYDPPEGDGRRLDALACMLPAATLYTGEGKVVRGAGKASLHRVALVDALVPAGSAAAALEHVTAVASAVSPDVVVSPACQPIPIPYPPGYPVDDPTRVYRPGGQRASAVAGGRQRSLAEHWAAQREVDR